MKHSIQEVAPTSLALYAELTPWKRETNMLEVVFKACCD